MNKCLNSCLARPYQPRPCSPNMRKQRMKILPYEFQYSSHLVSPLLVGENPTLKGTKICALEGEGVLIPGLIGFGRRSKTVELVQ